MARTRLMSSSESATEAHAISIFRCNSSSLRHHPNSSGRRQQLDGITACIMRHGEMHREIEKWSRTEGISNIIWPPRLVAPSTVYGFIAVTNHGDKLQTWWPASRHESHLEFILFLYVSCYFCSWVANPQICKNILFSGHQEKQDRCKENGSEASISLVIKKSTIVVGIW